MLKIIEKWLYSPKYVVVFVRKYIDGYRKVKSLTFRSITQLNIKNNKAFIIDVNKPAYSHKNLYVYFVNDESTKTISFYEKDQPLNMDEIDLIVANHLLREITKGLMNDTKTMIVYLVVGGIIGLLIGLFGMNLFMNNKINEIYKEFINDEPIIIGTIKMFKVFLFG